jgi:hypothetical protein
MLSLAYSLVSLAFGVNLTHSNSVTSPTEVTIASEGNAAAFGHATFMVYWMLNFCGMIALDMACENVAMGVGAPWMGLFLVFWIISNISAAFYDVQIAPGFYEWGYAWPLHASKFSSFLFAIPTILLCDDDLVRLTCASVVQASRTILFDLHSRLGLNFGVLIAWGALNTLLYPFCCWFMRWKERRGDPRILASRRIVAW